MNENWLIILKARKSYDTLHAFLRALAFLEVLAAALLVMFIVNV